MTGVSTTMAPPSASYGYGNPQPSPSLPLQSGIPSADFLPTASGAAESNLSWEALEVNLKELISRKDHLEKGDYRDFLKRLLQSGTSLYVLDQHRLNKDHVDKQNAILKKYEDRQLQDRDVEHQINQLLIVHVSQSTALESKFKALGNQIRKELEPLDSPEGSHQDGVESDGLRNRISMTERGAAFFSKKIILLSSAAFLTLALAWISISQ